MLVSREDLEASIAELRREVRDPRAGIYGPGSISWSIDREMITFLAGGRAALLQLAHPFVAHGVDQHSATRHDPLGRFQRTFKHVYAMVFGDLDHAISAARRVYAVHQRIVGRFGNERYQANDVDALWWVHATLVDSAVQAYELAVRPLAPEERDEYLRQSRKFGRLFGISDDVMPKTWDEFSAYNQRMWHRLNIEEPAAQMATFLLRAPAALGPTTAARWLSPVARWYSIITAGLLPEPIRRKFADRGVEALRFGRGRQLAFDASLKSIALTYRQLPARLRQVPAYRHALRRLRGEPGPDPFGAWVERTMEMALKSA